jgi:rubrerythrin
MEGWLVIIVILAIIGAIYNSTRFRCPRCGYRDQRGNFTNGRCPSCGSKEL